jgi:hypothetical protein
MMGSIFYEKTFDNIGFEIQLLNSLTDVRFDRPGQKWIHKFP